MEMLFQWANDPLVRKNSFSTKPITWEEHQEWFANVLKSESVRQYIFMVGEQPVGGIRVAVEGKKAVISYNVCADMRGRGYGTQMLEIIKERGMRDFPEVSCLVGEVKKENLASKKAFLSAGYLQNENQFEFELKEKRLGEEFQRIKKQHEI